MFGLGWTEMLVVGIVALIVVGPDDLPQMFRSVGRFTGKARQMAREFSRAMNDAADQSGVNDIERTIRAASNPKKFGADSIRKATGSGSEGGEGLSPERQAAKDKISQATAKKAEARRAAEEAAEEEAADELLLDEDLAPPADQPREGVAKPDPHAPRSPEEQPAGSESDGGSAESGKK